MMRPFFYIVRVVLGQVCFTVAVFGEFDVTRNYYQNTFGLDGVE